MKSAFKRGLPLAIALISVLVAAAPANASLTPTSGAISATASDSTLIQGALTVSCGRSTFTGTISNGGNTISGTLDFRDGTGRTCTESLFRTSCRVTTTGLITLTNASSVAGVSASANAQIDAGTTFVIDCLGLRRTVAGLQRLGTCATFTQATQILNVSCNVVDTGGTAARFAGRYAVTSGRVTVS